jgi:hypothetical protein
MVLIADARVEAARIWEEARRHKREQQRHRRMAQERMAELERFCRAHGIRYEEVTYRGEVQGHGQPPGRSGI